MKTLLHHLCTALILCSALSSCTEELPNVTGKNHIYNLNSVSSEMIDGHVKIRERFDGSIQLELALENTDANKIYPAYIHFNNLLDGGGVALTLTPVNGQSQSSVTEIKKLDSGAEITYEDLRDFDGHLNIQLDNDQGKLVAQADIGTNALTGKFQQFQLVEGDVAGASGIITIAERESGFSLVTIDIDGAIEGKQHPITLNFGSMYSESELAGSLRPVNGDTGISKTHIEKLNGDLVAPYEALVAFEGFVRVHMGEGDEMNTILAQGNIAYVEN